MEIKQLRYLIAVAENGSMHMAAEKLHVSQQNISRVLKQLENEVQTPLLNRSVFGITLTEDGQYIYSRALSIMQEVAALESKYIQKESVAVLTGMLQIYFSNSLSDWVDNYILPFQRQYAHIKITATELSTNEIMQLLPTATPNALYFVQSSMQRLQQEMPLLREQYSCHLLASDPLKISMDKSNPQSSKTSISLKKLATLPLAFKSPSFDVMPSLVQILLDSGIPLNLKYCSNSDASLIKYIRQNMAVTLFTKSNSTSVNMESFITIPIKERIYVTLCFLVPKYNLSPCAQAFYDLFLKNMPAGTQNLF